MTASATALARCACRIRASRPRSPRRSATPRAWSTAGAGSDEPRDRVAAPAASRRRAADVLAIDPARTMLRQRAGRGAGRARERQRAAAARCELRRRARDPDDPSLARTRARPRGDEACGPPPRAAAHALRDASLLAVRLLPGCSRDRPREHADPRRARVCARRAVRLSGADPVRLQRRLPGRLLAAARGRTCGEDVRGAISALARLEPALPRTAPCDCGPISPAGPGGDATASC
jgi:hypothetical protein